jgi:hypothetical protein
MIRILFRILSIALFIFGIAMIMSINPSWALEKVIFYVKIWTISVVCGGLGIIFSIFKH